MPVDPMRESDIVDELAQHVAEHYADLLSSGVPEAEAVTIALAPLDDPGQVAAEIARADRPRGAVARLKPSRYEAEPSHYRPEPSGDEPVRRWAGAARLLVDLARDVRYAARLLRRAPGFTAIALVTLALGIGANTAIFSVLNAVLLRPLPYADPDRLVMIGERGPDGSAGNVGYTTFLDWRDRSRSFESMAAFANTDRTLTALDRPVTLFAHEVTPNLFDVAGIRALRGRTFLPDEGLQDKDDVALISYAL
jgi:hypothetical protein